MRRRRWWLTPGAVAFLVVALLAVASLGGLWVWSRLRSPSGDSTNTVWVSLYPGRGGNGLVVVAVERGRVADPGPFGERVAALVAPTARRAAVDVDENLDGGFKLVGVHLSEPLLPRRLDTEAVQQTLAAAGFRWLVVRLSVEQRSQVVPEGAAEAGECWGDRGLSCEWRIATAGPPLRFEARTSSS